METNKSYIKKLNVGDTKKYGKGIYAKEDIKKGTKIFILSGPTMTPKDFLNEVNSDKENIDDPLQVGRRTYINLDKISRTFNHSCNPNAGLRNRSEMFALRDIKKGEEITYDYSLTVAPTEWRMECKCGSKNCRKVLGDIKSVPKKQIEYYKKLGDLQRYMKYVLKEVESKKYKIPKYEIELLSSLKKTDNL